MTRAPTTLILATTLAALAGCQGDAGGGPDDDGGTPPVLALRAIPAPAGSGAGEPELGVGPAGVFLSWLEPAEGGRHALRLARFQDGGWGEPATVMERDGLFVNWADFPSVVPLPDGTLVAHWLQKSGPSTYAYDVRMAVSPDGGRSWSDDVIPHRDGVLAEHGFVSLFPVGDSVGAVWLDGRATPDGEPMTLRFATVAPDGTPGPDELLDASTCDCCQTSVALAAAGPVVAYRDRTADEVRDIYVARRVDGRWSEGRPVHDDGWTIAACPVNGPAIAADGSRVAVAWFTGAAGEAGRVRVAFSDDGGATFGDPVQGDDGRPVGRVDLVLLDGGDALLSWVERTDAGAEVRLRRVRDGAAGPGLRLTATDAGRASGFPRMARLGDRVFFAWTEAGEPSSVRTAVARLTGGDEAAQRPESTVADRASHARVAGAGAGP